MLDDHFFRFFVCLVQFIIIFSNWVADRVYPSIGCVLVLRQDLFIFWNKKLWNRFDFWLKWLTWVIFLRVLTHGSWLRNTAFKLSRVPWVIHLFAVLTFIRTYRIFTKPVLIGLNTFLKVFICYLLVFNFKKMVFIFGSCSKRAFTVNYFLCRGVLAFAAALGNDIKLLHYLRIVICHRLLII